MLLFAVDDVVKGWGDFGLLGLVIGTLMVALLWFMRYVVTVTLPNAERMHQEAIIKLTADHATTTLQLTVELKEARTQYAHMVKEEREECQRRHIENTQIFRGMVDSLKDLRREVKS